MDVEPIYCAEQIVVPPNLADVLKAYTKEVIRRQPQDILEFSAKYFANLANVAAGVANTPAPTQQQLKQVYQRGGSGAAPLNKAQVTGLCQQAGVADAVVGKVLDVGAFEPSSIDFDKFTFLMLAMSCEDFNRLCMGMFEIFSDTGALQTEKFLKLLSYLGPDMDAEVTDKFMARVGDEIGPAPSITYVDVCELPSLRIKLGLA